MIERKQREERRGFREDQPIYIWYVYFALRTVKAVVVVNSSSINTLIDPGRRLIDRGDDDDDCSLTFTYACDG